MRFVVNNKLDEISNIVDNSYSRLFIVDSRSENKLGNFVRDTRNEKRFSVQDVSDRAKRGGKSISPAYVNRLENEIINISIPKQEALAKGLGVSPEIIFDLTRGVEFDDEDAERVELEAMYRKRRNLSPAKKAAFRRLLEMVDRELDKMIEEDEEEMKKQKVKSKR